jgi:hypothetical protein
MLEGKYSSSPARRSPSVWPITQAGRPAATPGRQADNLFLYIFQMSGRQQVLICLLSFIIAGLETVPLELQRQIVNRAIGGQDARLLVILGLSFFAATLLQAGGRTNQLIIAFHHRAERARSFSKNAAYR